MRLANRPSSAPLRCLTRWMFFLAPLSMAWAEDDVIGRSSAPLVAEHLVSVSAGYSQSEQSAAAVTSVITAEQIKNMGAQNLYDILQTIPGFFLGQNTIQIEPILSVRGFKSSFNHKHIGAFGWNPANRAGDRRPDGGVGKNTARFN